MRFVLSCDHYTSAKFPSEDRDVNQEQRIALTDPGAALLRPPIFPAEASIRFNLSMMGE
jgi:hypothetical protein